jgi:hypothetical protein
MIAAWKSGAAISNSPLPDEADDLKTDIDSKGAELKVQVGSRGNQTLITVIPPQVVANAGTDICVVVDISGSMNTKVELKTDSGTESHGFNILNLVQHSCLSIVDTLGANDRFALVTYSTNARTELTLTPMNDAGKRRAQACIKAMKPEYTTNIWDGLRTGMEILRQHHDPSRNSSAMLLTDGLPNVQPMPRFADDYAGGILQALKTYMTEFNPAFNVHTFGFGYSLDSTMLSQMAVTGNGSYSFIPDGSFVGTVFINKMANIMSTAARGVRVIVTSDAIEPLDGLGKYLYRRIDGGIRIKIGSVFAGQPRHLIVTGNYSEMKVTVTYDGIPQQKETCVEHKGGGNVEELLDHQCRLALVSALWNAMEAGRENGATYISSLLDQLKGNQVSPFIRDLVRDVEGQVTEAFSREDWYDRWGKHYLLSLYGAHFQEECNNFKDPGVQHYGGPLFKKLQGHFEDAFAKIVPPKPARRGRNDKTVTAATMSSNYYNMSGPCFHGNCTVLTEHGTTKRLCELKKGDILQTHQGSAKVICLLKTPCAEGKVRFVRLPGGLVITPWHPIKLEGKWVFPENVQASQEEKCNFVYNLVMSSDHVVTINGIQCITLAHDYEDDPVLAHPYYGTKRILYDLRQMNGWGDGLIVMQGRTVRDPETHLVTNVV